MCFRPGVIPEHGTTMNLKIIELLGPALPSGPRILVCALSAPCAQSHVTVTLQDLGQRGPMPIDVGLVLHNVAFPTHWRV